jgi:hypothetical protein
LLVLGQKEEEGFCQSFRAYALARLLASLPLAFFIFSFLNRLVLSGSCHSESLFHSRQANN